MTMALGHASSSTGTPRQAEEPNTHRSDVSYNSTWRAEHHFNESMAKLDAEFAALAVEKQYLTPRDVLLALRRHARSGSSSTSQISKMLPQILLDEHVLTYEQAESLVNEVVKAPNTNEDLAIVSDLAQVQLGDCMKGADVSGYTAARNTCA